MNGDHFPIGESAESAEPAETRTIVAGGRAASVEPSALQELTPREREVLSLLPDCGGNRELARHLGIAERTVKAHLTSITRKLGLRNRVEAVILSVRWAQELRPDAPDLTGRSAPAYPSP